MYYPDEFNKDLLTSERRINQCKATINQNVDCMTEEDKATILALLNTELNNAKSLDHKALRNLVTKLNTVLDTINLEIDKYRRAEDKNNSQSITRAVAKFDPMGTMTIEIHDNATKFSGNELDEIKYHVKGSPFIILKDTQGKITHVHEISTLNETEKKLIIQEYIVYKNYMQKINPLKKAVGTNIKEQLNPPSLLQRLIHFAAAIYNAIAGLFSRLIDGVKGLFSSGQSEPIKVDKTEVGASTDDINKGLGATPTGRKMAGGSPWSNPAEIIESTTKLHKDISEDEDEDPGPDSTLKP